MTLSLARGLQLPLSAVTQKIAFLARTGAGKTYAAGKTVEQMLTHDAQVIVIDPVGVWYGLRLKADGKRQGYSIPILGGEHGDIQLESGAGALIADVAVQRRQSMVIDVSTMRKAQATRFVTDFAEQFFHKKKSHKSPVHVVFEEAQRFVPQFSKGKERLVGAVEDIVKVGRNYGIGTTLISQRPQAINKDVLNQTEMLVVLQISGPQERKAIKAWINEKGADESPLDDLDELEVGEAVVWSPSWLRVLKRVRINKKVTYDASATPDFETMAYVEPKPLSAGDLRKLENDMGDMVEEQKARDPAHLKQRIRELEHECTQLRITAAKTKTKVQIKKVPAVTESQLKRIEKIVERLERVGTQANHEAEILLTAVRSAQNGLQVAMSSAPITESPPVPVETKKAARALSTVKTTNMGTNGVRKGVRRILAYLSTFQQWGLTKKQLATVVGMSFKSGTFNQYLAQIKKNGWAQVQGDRFHITHAGEGYLVEVGEPVPDKPYNTATMLALWTPKMRAGARAILELIVQGGHAFDKQRLADSLDMSYKSGTFNQYLALLKACNLIRVEGGIFQATAFAQAS